MILLANVPSEQLVSKTRSFDEVQLEIEKIELETNQRITEVLSSCDEEVYIRVLDFNFTRNERESAYPVQIDALKLKVAYPNNVPPQIREFNRIFGGVHSSSISDT